MRPEQEVLADLLKAVGMIVRSAREATPLAGSPPEDDVAFAAMTPVQRIATTALLKQFEQLEGMLSSLFRAVLRTLGVRLKGLYPQDIANKMTEMGVMDEPDRWVEIVKLRNDLVHEYPLGSSDRYGRFVEALRSLPFLFDAAERVGRIIADRGLIKDDS